MSKRRHSNKLSKAQCYLHGISTMPYDLHGMIKAFGPDHVHLMVDAIVAGKIDVRQCVDRWAAHVQLFGTASDANTWFAQHQDEFTLSNDECLELLRETA